MSLAVCAALTPQTAAPALAQDGVRDDLKRLQDTWHVDSAMYKGVKDAGALKPAKAVRITFVGEFLTIRHPPGNEERIAFHLDPTKQPKQIDMSEGVKGIYELKGDTVKLCWDKQAKKRGRPAMFPAKPPTDSAVFYLILNREKP